MPEAAEAQGGRERHADREAPEAQATAHHAAFTLIELLVVVAIIALLVTILSPTLHLAKSLARRTVCAANVHNMTGCTLVYANENASVFPDFSYKVFPYWMHTEPFDYFRETYAADVRNWYYCPDNQDGWNLDYLWDGWGTWDDPGGFRVISYVYTGNNDGLDDEVSRYDVTPDRVPVFHRTLFDVACYDVLWFDLIRHASPAYNNDWCEPGRRGVNHFDFEAYEPIGGNVGTFDGAVEWVPWAEHTNEFSCGGGWVIHW